MGIVSSIQNCLADQPAPILKPIQVRDRLINQDYQYFSHQNWYKFKAEILFDTNKFIFLYNDYAETQRSLLQLWKIVDINKLKAGQRGSTAQCLMSNRWKYAIRRGVPINLYKTMIEALFQNRIRKDPVLRYQNLIFEKIKRQKLTIQPKTFKHETEQTFQQPFLNKLGQQCLKRVTFMLSLSSGMDYNPYILTTLSILIIFVGQAMTFQIASYLIESSFSAKQEQREALKYHFTLNEYQFQKLAQKFYKTVKKISPTIRIINEHLNTQGIQKVKLFKEIVGNFFMGYLPFSIILKIFLIFINEGIQIFYRIFYAIFKISGPGIRDSSNNNQILRSIKSKMFVYLSDQANARIFFKYAFDLKIQVNFNRFMDHESIKSKNNSQEGIYYLPCIKGISEILSYQCVQDIWAYLPEFIKHYNLTKIYPQQEQTESLSLKKMLTEMRQYNFTLIIIESLKGQIFGVFLAAKITIQKQLIQQKSIKSYISTPAFFLQESQQDCLSLLSRSNSNQVRKQSNKVTNYFGSSQSFVFTISPKKNKFTATGENVLYCSYNQLFFAIGGPQSKPALQLNSTLSVGLSFVCPTYGNTPLHNGPPGQFRIQKIQCFCIE